MKKITCSDFIKALLSRNRKAEEKDLDKLSYEENETERTAED